MRIALDFDDVCVDSETFKLQYYQKFYNIGHELEFTNRTTLVESGQLSLEQYRAIQQEIYTNVELSLEKLQFREGFLLNIRKIIRLGHTIGIVTARSGDTLEIAEQILSKADLDILLTGVGYGQSKEDALQEYNLFIDDEPRNLLPLVAGGILLFIMTTKENKDFHHPNIKRVNDWNEFYNEIASLEQ